MGGILERLRGGDRRSIGEVEVVIAIILETPALFGEVLEGMRAEDPVLRMRAADAVEKVTRRHPELLHPFKKRLLGEFLEIEQQEVRWHLAQMLPRLDYEGVEKRQAVALLLDWARSSKSRIVQVNAMQALADLAIKDEELRPAVLDALEGLVEDGSAAVVSRGRKLIVELKRAGLNANQLNSPI